VITAPESSAERLEEIFKGLPLRMAGRITRQRRFVVTGSDGATLLDETLERLRESWLSRFGDLI
jgi:hypothetical protein